MTISKKGGKFPSLLYTADKDRQRQTDRQTDWEKGREASKQADGLTERLRDRRIDRLIGKKDAETEMTQAHKSVVIT